MQGAGPFCSPDSQDLFPAPAGARTRPPPGPGPDTQPNADIPTGEFDPLPPAPVNQPSPRSRSGGTLSATTGPDAPRTGGLRSGETPRSATLEEWTEWLRGPLGTPSTFREERGGAAGGPRGGAHREAARDSPPAGPRRRARSPPGSPQGTPPPPHGAAPLRSPEGPAAPRPASPRRPEPRGHPSSASQPLRGSAPHSQRGPTPFPAAATSPPPAAPHRVSATAGGRAHAAAPARPATALRAARSRLLQPGTRRDIRARIPTPGLFLGVRPRPGRNSFFAARVRTARTSWCPSAGLASPFLSASSLSSLPGSPFRVYFCSRWVLKGLSWTRRGTSQREPRLLNS